MMNIKAKKARYNILKMFQSIKMEIAAIQPSKRKAYKKTVIKLKFEI